MFLAEGIADRAADRRPGARHALMIFARGEERAVAERTGVAFAVENGWVHVEVQRGKTIGADPAVVDDEVLRAAAEAALELGATMVVYEVEVPPNA
jgi:hypothetical protein